MFSEFFVVAVWLMRCGAELFILWNLYRLFFFICSCLCLHVHLKLLSLQDDNSELRQRHSPLCFRRREWIRRWTSSGQTLSWDHEVRILIWLCVGPLVFSSTTRNGLAEFRFFYVAYLQVYFEALYWSDYLMDIILLSACLRFPWTRIWTRHFPQIITLKNPVAFEEPATAPFR